MVVAKIPERLSGLVAEAASVSRPRDLSHASSAPGCTSAAGNVAVAVVVANGGTSCGTSWGSFPAQLAPRAGGTGFTHQVRAQLLQCPSGRRCAERQLYDFSSHSGAAQTRPPLCGPPRLRQDGVVSEGRLSRPNWVKSFLGAGITTGGQLYPLARQVPSLTIAPHPC